MTDKKLIYKIVHRDQWSKALAEGVFAGAEIDLTDGFIHFSAADQVKETANRHFSGFTDLLLIAFESEPFGESLKWEASRGGDLFPHLYGELNPEQAVFVKELLMDHTGKFQFPILDHE